MFSDMHRSIVSRDGTVCPLADSVYLNNHRNKKYKATIPKRMNHIGFGKTVTSPFAPPACWMLLYISREICPLFFFDGLRLHKDQNFKLHPRWIELLCWSIHFSSSAIINPSSTFSLVLVRYHNTVKMVNMADVHMCGNYQHVIFLLGAWL